MLDEEVNGREGQEAIKRLTRARKPARFVRPTDYSQMAETRRLGSRPPFDIEIIRQGGKHDARWAANRARGVSFAGDIACEEDFSSSPPAGLSISCPHFELAG